MAKKGLLVVALAFFAASGVFAQQKNNIIIDAGPLLKGIIASNDAETFFGAGVEYLRGLGKSFGIGIRGDFMTGADQTYLAISVHGRQYLTTLLKEAFLDAGVGFNRLSWASGSIFSGLTFELKAGYTVAMGKTIRVEPTLGYILSKSGGSMPTPLGWQIGLGFGFSI
ncbi:MAG: hypothetical protein LBD22_05375 [Spirochaetaceae bacterium]|jgi:hypothetical protein|nr:hypothetical protein [Spirochaetaceae bacterium]